jgi:hypothetical protein
MRPSTTPNVNYANLRVSNIFDPISNTWDQELLHTIFNVEDAADVSKISLHTRAPQDIIIWKATPISNYSIKSASCLCLNLV